MENSKTLLNRIPDVLREKLHYVADYYGRSANSHILFLIRQNTEAFEKDIGSILPCKK